METAGFHPTGFPSVEIGERLPAPEVQCLPEHIRRSLGLSDGEQLAAAADQPLEMQSVKLVGRYREAIALRKGLDRLRSQELAEPGHTALDDLLRGGRRGVSPERIGQPLGGADLTGSHRKRCENHPVAWADLANAPVEDKRAKKPNPHERTVPPRADTGQGR